MKWLPALFKSKAPTIERQNYEVQIRQAEALTSLAKGVNSIAAFLSSGALAQVLGQYSRSQIAKDIFGGLAAHGGRDALDARFIKQNATEIIAAIEAVFDKAAEKAQAVAKGETFDPELKDAEKDYLKWKSENS